MSKTITFKMKKERTETEFAVFPFREGDRQIHLQSDDRCMIVDLDRGRTFVSPKFKCEPMFEACDPSYKGSQTIKTPGEILQQLELN